MAYRGTTKSIAEIGHELGVDSALQGSVRRAGSRVRIVAQLIDAASQRPVWSETFDRDLTDIFAIQSEVALQIASALRAELSPVESARIGRAPTTDVRAYELLLRGRQQYLQFTGASMRAGLALFERATVLDGNFAPAWAATALALLELGETGELVPTEAYPRALAAAQRATVLDPSLAEGHVARGYGLMVHDFDWVGAEARRDAEAVDGAGHADRLAEPLDLAEADQVHHVAGARVVAHDDHHHQRVAEGDPEAGRQVLEGARVVGLEAGVDRHLLVQRELAVVDRLQRGHHDGDLARARRRHRHVAQPVGARAGSQILEIPARLERERVAEGVEAGGQLLHGATPPAPAS